MREAIIIYYLAKLTILQVQIGRVGECYYLLLIKKHISTLNMRVTETIFQLWFASNRLKHSIGFVNYSCCNKLVINIEYNCNIVPQTDIWRIGLISFLAKRGREAFVIYYFEITNYYLFPLENWRIIQAVMYNIIKQIHKTSTTNWWYT